MFNKASNTLIKLLSKNSTLLKPNIVKPQSKQISFTRSIAPYRFYSTETKQSASENEEVEQSTSEQNENDKLYKEEISKLNEKVEELTDKYKRSLADNENIRSRMVREVGEAKLYGIQKFCKDLLQVSDILDTAVSIAHQSLFNEKEQITIKDNDLEPVKNFYDGVKMTETELLKVFKNHGLAMFQPEVGDKFDPYQHEAMFEVPTKDYEPGHIAHVQNHGYKFHDRTLRPATVGVAKAP